MPRTRLARAALATAVLSFPVAGLMAVPSGAAFAAALTASPTAGVTREVAAWQASQASSSFNKQVAAYVKRFEGTPYRYGGTTPSGFDCSGLAQYVYRHFHKSIQRTAEAQFREFKRISKAHAQPGDLVFFHESSDPGSYVYHVGVYEGGTNMVDSPHTGSSVGLRSFSWAGNTVTFGTISH
jgi:cell wall-associated NlpC family hydrolase